MSNKDFKQTKIGKIPKEWDEVRLGDENIAELIMGQSPPSSTYNDKKTGLPFLQGNAEFGDMYPMPVFSCSQPTKLSEKNDILLSVRAPVGDINISPYKLCIGRGLAAIRPKRNKLNYLFLFYYLKFGSRIFESISMGSTFKAIRKEEVEKFQLPLPPLPEQQKIAEILMTADEAIQKVDEAIKKTQRLKKGLMQKLLTKGIGHKEFKETEIGRIPKGWQIRSLDDIGTLQYGITKSATKVNTGVRFLRITDITDEGIKWSGVPYCELTKSELEKYGLREGDILFARIGATTGKTCFIEGNLQSVYGSYLLKFNPTVKDIDTKFIYFFTQSLFYWRQVNANKGGQLKGGLNTKLLGNIKLPFPPLPEQQKISEILSTVDRRLELLREKKKRFERVKRGLMNDLLTGKKRVKLEA